MWDPRTFVKPPLPIRRALEANEGMRIIKRHTIKGKESLAAGVDHSSDVESMCFGYGITLEFPRVNLWGAPVETVEQEPVVIERTQVIAEAKPVQEEPNPPSNSAIWYIGGAALVLGVLYAHGVE